MISRMRAVSISWSVKLCQPNNGRGDTTPCDRWWMIANPRLLQGACGSIPWVSPAGSKRRVGAAGRGVGHPLGFHERSIPNPMTSSHATAAPVQYGASGGSHEALQRVTHQVKMPVHVRGCVAVFVCPVPRLS